MRNLFKVVLLTALFSLSAVLNAADSNQNHGSSSGESQALLEGRREGSSAAELTSDSKSSDGEQFDNEFVKKQQQSRDTKRRKSSTDADLADAESFGDGLDIVTDGASSSSVGSPAKMSRMQQQSSNTISDGRRREGDMVDEEEAEGNVTRVNICCEVDQLFNQTVMQCQDSSHHLVPVFHDEKGRVVPGVHYEPVTGLPNCSFFVLSPSTTGPDDHFTLGVDGLLRVGEGDADTMSFTMAQGSYCLLFPQPDLVEAFVCFPEQEASPTQTVNRRHFQKLVYPVGLLVSSVFLLLTLAVHCLLRELREDLLAKCLMCSIAMLAQAQLLMVANQWGAYYVWQTPYCVVLASLTHFSFLSAFLWLNVICVTVLRSLWWSAAAAPCKGGRRSPLLAGGLYAWGVAGLVTLVALVRDQASALQGSALPTPRFGAASCWFSNSAALLLYMLGPVSVLLVVNLVCFCLAAYRMYSLQQQHSHRTTSHFSQYLKLFVLMGVSWIFEVISFFVSHNNEDHPINYVWVFFDLVNILQGVLVFVLFVCRPAVLRHLKRRLCGASPAGGETEVAPSNTVV